MLGSYYTFDQDGRFDARSVVEGIVVDWTEGTKPKPAPENVIDILPTIQRRHWLAEQLWHPTAGVQLGVQAKLGLVSNLIQPRIRLSCTPAARSCRTQNAGERQPLAWQRASPFFCQQVLQRRVVEHRIRQELLQPGILALQWRTARPERTAWKKSSRPVQGRGAVHSWPNSSSPWINSMGQRHGHYNTIRADLKARGVKSVIPPKSNRTG